MDAAKSVELMFSKNFKNQNDILDESHERLISATSDTYDVALPFEYFQECWRLVCGIDDMKGEHVATFPFEKGQSDEGNPCLFVDFQERGVFHVFEDSFANMLQSLENVKLAMFSDQGYHF